MIKVAGILLSLGGAALYVAGLVSVWTDPDITTAGALALSGLLTVLAAFILSLAEMMSDD